MGNENKGQMLALAAGMTASAVLGAVIATALVLPRVAFGREMSHRDFIRTRGIIVQDKDGRPRVSIGVTRSGSASCTLFGRHDDPRLILDVDAVGKPSLSLTRANGSSIVMEIGPKDGPSLGMSNKHSYVNLAAGATGSTAALIFGPRDHFAILNLAAADRKASMMMDGSREKATVDLSADGAKSASSLDMSGGKSDADLKAGRGLLTFNLIDPYDTSAGITVNRHSQPGVYVQDKDGIKVFRVPGAYDGP